MRITGIVAEYNPFHNGHKYQIDVVKKHSDAVIAVMSGSFVQRGEAAVFDKWTRTRAALLGGADLVLELPACFSVNAAERFAFGAVSLLDQLCVVDTLCFGSESGDPAQLEHAAALLLREPEEVSLKIKQYMQEGLCYPAARQKAYAGLIPESILRLPNNILALEYLCALQKLNSAMRPVTIRRKAVGYHDADASGRFASAKAIRNRIESGKPYFEFVPTQTLPAYENAVQYDTARLDAVLSYFLRTCQPETLKTINDVSEGLENRLIAAGKQSAALESIVQYTKTKRYTAARIQRICISALLALTPEISKKPPAYVRVLGMNKIGKSILTSIRKTSPLRIITKTADYSQPDPMFAKDVLATDLAALCAAAPSARTAGKDFTTSPIIL